MRSAGEAVAMSPDPSPAPRGGSARGRADTSLWSVTKQTFTEFLEDKALKEASALAYPVIFALGPLLLITISIAGFIFGDGPARQMILEQARAVGGPAAGDTLATMLDGAAGRLSGTIGLAIGILAALVAAAGVFGALKQALNRLWEVEHRPVKGWKAKVKDFVKEELVSFGAVILVGLLLLASIAASAVLALIGPYITGGIPGGALLWQLVTALVSVAILTLAFGLLFKLLPDVAIRWRDVWIGGAVTAVLFVIGEMALAFYFGRSNLTSMYGAAGAVLLVLSWIYYSAVIVFLGAEFTQVYTNLRGGGMRPEPDARTLQQAVNEEQAHPGDEGPDRARKGGRRRGPAGGGAQ